MENGCLDVELGTPVEFEMTVKLKECEADVFEVSPIGLNEAIAVEVEPLCDCPCSRDEPEVTCNNPICNSRSVLSIKKESNQA